MRVASSHPRVVCDSKRRRREVGGMGGHGVGVQRDHLQLIELGHMVVMVTRGVPVEVYVAHALDD